MSWSGYRSRRDHHLITASASERIMARSADHRLITPTTIRYLHAPYAPPHEETATMKITSVEFLPVHDRRTAFFVAVDTDEGISGIGECGLPRAHSKVAATAGMVEDYARLLVGK